MSLNDLTTEADLAKRFGLTPQQAAEKRQKQGWPYVKLGRFEIRYTEDQIAQIIAMRSVGGAVASKPSSGLTKRSAGAA